MASNIYIPFNHRPANIDFKNNASYTVPAGYYARVVATCTVSAYAAVSPSSAMTMGMTSNSCVIELWVDAGDIVSSSRVQPSSSGSQIHADYAEATVTVNSNVIGKCRTYASGSANSSVSVTVIGHADVSFHIEEYPIVS